MEGQQPLRVRHPETRRERRFGRHREPEQTEKPWQRLRRAAIVGIDCNPGPDAQDRLRRIFAILASHFAGEDMTGPEPGSPPADSPPGDGNE